MATIELKETQLPAKSVFDSRGRISIFIDTAALRSPERVSKSLIFLQENMKNGKLPIGDYALEAIESQKVSELLASPALPFPEYQLSTLEDESVDDSFREGYAKGVHLADKLVEKEPQLLVAWHSLLTSNKKDFYDQLSELGFNEDDFGIKSEALTLSYFPRGADKPTFDSCALVLGFTQEIKRLNEQLLATTNLLWYCGLWTRTDP